MNFKILMTSILLALAGNKIYAMEKPLEIFFDDTNTQDVSLEDNSHGFPSPLDLSFFYLSIEQEISGKTVILLKNPIDDLKGYWAQEQQDLARFTGLSDFSRDFSIRIYDSKSVELDTPDSNILVLSIGDALASLRLSGKIVYYNPMNNRTLQEIIISKEELYTGDSSLSRKTPLQAGLVVLKALENNLNSVEQLSYSDRQNYESLLTIGSYIEMQHPIDPLPSLENDRNSINIKTQSLR